MNEPINVAMTSARSTLVLKNYRYVQTTVFLTKGEREQIQIYRLITHEDKINSSLIQEVVIHHTDKR